MELKFNSKLGGTLGGDFSNGIIDTTGSPPPIRTDNLKANEKMVTILSDQYREAVKIAGDGVPVRLELPGLTGGSGGSSGSSDLEKCAGRLIGAAAKVLDIF